MPKRGINSRVDLASLLRGRKAEKRANEFIKRHKTRWDFILTIWAANLRVLMGLLPSDVRAVHLLPQNPNYSDEEDEVHLPGGGKPTTRSGDGIMRGGVWNVVPWLTSMVTKIGVLMIHHRVSSIISQHLWGVLRTWRRHPRTFTVPN